MDFDYLLLFGNRIEIFCFAFTGLFLENHYWLEGWNSNIILLAISQILHNEETNKKILGVNKDDISD